MTFKQAKKVVFEATSIKLHKKPINTQTGKKKVVFEATSIKLHKKSLTPKQAKKKYLILKPQPLNYNTNPLTVITPKQAKPK